MEVYFRNLHLATAEAQEIPNDIEMVFMESSANLRSGLFAYSPSEAYGVMKDK